MKKFLSIVTCLLLLAASYTAYCAEEQIILLALDRLREPADTQRMAAAEQAMAEAYPDMKCLIRYADDRDIQQYSAGKVPETADILYLRSADLTRLADHGGMFDLRESEKMAALLENLPDYGRLTGGNGHVYALPRLLMVQLMRIGDRDALKAIGLHEEKMLLWEQLFEAAPRLKAYNDQNGKSLKLLFDRETHPAFLSQFYWDEVNQPSDAALREKRLTALMQGFQALEEAGMLARDRQEETVLALNYTEPRTLNAESYLLPPACSMEGLRAALSAEFFVVRAASDKRDASLALLEGLFSEKAVESSGEYAESGVYLKDGEAKYFKTDAALSIWRQGIALGYPQAVNENLARILTHWSAYRKGILSLEDCVQAMLKQLP